MLSIECSSFVVGCHWLPHQVFSRVPTSLSALATKAMPKIVLSKLNFSIVAERASSLIAAEAFPRFVQASFSRPPLMMVS